MPRWASFAMVFLLPLFSQFCFGEQPAHGSTAAKSGLRGPVKSVFTESVIYGDNDEKKPGFSERFTYDRSGYETELYEYDFRGVHSHTVYTRNDGHLVKTETTNPLSNQKSVQPISRIAPVPGEQTTQACANA